MTDRPTVAVVGAGAIGAFFAAHLVEADTAEVQVCVRTPFDELVVESGDVTLRSRPTVRTDPDQVSGPVDWVLLATKAHQTEGAAGWLDALVGPDTTVVVLQNGVEQVERVRPYVGDEVEVLPAVVYCGAEVLAPGHIVHRTNGLLIVPAGPAASRLEALYEPVRAGIRPSEDHVTDLWQKLVGNVVANGITALTGRRMEVLRRPDVAEVAAELARECVAVARAEGATIDDGYVDLLTAGMAAMPPDSGTSMLYDRQAGRVLEVDALHGAVIRAGARHGIPTPLHATFAALLTAIGDPGPGSA